MTEDTAPRRRGRPATGQVPKRDIRIGEVWDVARAAAEEDGERFAAFVERALLCELRRRNRARQRAATRTEPL